MRIGAPGAEKPVARLDDDTYVDLSDVEVWLQPGDVMELGITGLGRQRQRVLEQR